MDEIRGDEIRGGDARARRWAISVDRDSRGLWKVAMGDGGECHVCQTLDEARNTAYQCAACGQPCELIVRDAYHRVIERDLVGAGT